MDSLTVWQLLRLQSLHDGLAAAGATEAPVEHHVPHASLLHSMLDKGYENYRDLFQTVGGHVWDVRTPGRGDAHTSGIYCAVYPASAAAEEGDAPPPLPLQPFLAEGIARAPSALVGIEWASFASSINAYVTLACHGALKQPRPEQGIAPLQVRRHDHAAADAPVAVSIRSGEVNLPRDMSVEHLYDLVWKIVAAATAETVAVDVSVVDEWVLVILAATVSYIRRHDQVQAARFPLTLLEQLALHVSASSSRPAALERFLAVRLDVEYSPDEDAFVDTEDVNETNRRYCSYSEALLAFVDAHRVTPAVAPTV